MTLKPLKENTKTNAGRTLYNNENLSLYISLKQLSNFRVVVYDDCGWICCPHVAERDMKILPSPTVWV